MAGSDLYNGSLDLLIFKALSFGPLHGYGIGRWISQATREAIVIQEGALYPALHRLERQGLLDEEWGLTDTNREAKFYRLTPDGRKRLKAELQRWRAHTRVMNAALAASRA